MSLGKLATSSAFAGGENREGRSGNFDEALKLDPDESEPRGPVWARFCIYAGRHAATFSVNDGLTGWCERRGGIER